MYCSKKGCYFMSKGKFIVLEGLDGSGKSTQLKLIRKKLESLGKKVYCTAEPTDSPTGKYLRTILSESLEKDMYLQSALFLADRLEHITNPDCGIRKYLDEDYIVISDRFYFSSFAYQGTAIDMDWVMDINLKCERMLKPDLCIFFDVNPDTCKNRIDKTRSKPELYEKDIKKIREIRKNFLTVFEKLSDTHKIEIIDSNADINTINKKAFQYIESIITED